MAGEEDKTSSNVNIKNKAVCETTFTSVSGSRARIPDNSPQILPCG